MKRPATRQAHALAALCTALITVAAVLVVSPPSAGATATPGLTHLPRFGGEEEDVDWAGYAATGADGTFTAASASWTQPAVDCTVATRSFASFWVGLDGFADSTVEQLGTDSDCIKGQAYYYAWWEMFPKYPRLIQSKVMPGDRISASVTAVGDAFALTMTNATRGWTHTTTTSFKGAAAHRSSAETIMEVSCCTPGGNMRRLADFGVVQFTDAQANGAPIAASDPVKLNVRPRRLPTFSGTNTANTSDLTNGEDFTVTWAGS